MGRRHLKLIVVLVWLAAFGTPQQAFARDFGPFQGKVVDAATKEPVEGVVVLVEWSQIHFFSGSTFYDAQETLTDKQGAFLIPGIWVLNPWAHVSVEANIIVYKSGYQAIETGLFASWSQQINETLDYVLTIEDGKPTLMLKKLPLEERKRIGTPGGVAGIPSEKVELLIKDQQGKEIPGWGEVGPVRR